MGNRILAAAFAGGLIGGVALAAGPFGALGPVERGRWQLKTIGGADGRGVCLTDPLQLIQFHHPGAACPRFTIEDAADHVTIQYTCGSRGYGRTTITVKQRSLIRLDTQGIDAAGHPFDASYEGRFAGPCAPPPAR